MSGSADTDEAVRRCAFRRHVEPETEAMLRANRAVDRFDGRHPRARLLAILPHTHVDLHRRRRPVVMDGWELIHASRPAFGAAAHRSAEEGAGLVDGRLHQVAPVDELYRRPASLAVARLVGGFNEIAGTVAAGRYRSAWGVVDLPPGCDAEGPATLLVRREELEVAAPDAAPDAGTGPDSGRASLQARGSVVRVRGSGPRRTVDVEVGAGQARVVLEVELPIGERARVGEAVSVRTVPRAPPWAVHPPGDAPTGSRRLASR